MSRMQSVTDIIETLLAKRGVTPDTREAFLNPDYTKHVHDSFLMKNMDIAVARLRSAIENNEPITLYTDYDCDGIPGAVIGHDFFKKIGYENMTVMIPDRNGEGYGLHTHHIDTMAERGTKLLITVDLGIVAMEMIAYARSLGMDVIVCDHHEPHGVMPNAIILDPKQSGETYPFDGLSGAGVLFKLITGYIQKYPDGFEIGWEKWLLDMVGLAAVADMVPLVDENRVFAKYGLVVLRKSRRPGLIALLRELRVDQQYLTEEDIGFTIAPKLNVASRLASPMKAFLLLTTDDRAAAQMYAKELVALNDERKTLVAHMMKDVHGRLSKRTLRDVVVVGDPAWRIGVLGLVASKIVETYNRPAFVWGGDGVPGAIVFKGSCRGTSAAHVVEVMTHVRDTFVGYGGHEGAGGFEIAHANVHTLEEVLDGAFTAVKKEVSQSIEIPYDVVVPLALLNSSLHSELTVISPFGMGNSKPVFKIVDATVVSIKQFGKTKEHFEIVVQQDGRMMKAIAFFKTADDFTKTCVVGDNVSLLGHFELSRFMGKVELRMRIVDVV